MCFYVIRFHNNSNGTFLIIWEIAIAAKKNVRGADSLLINNSTWIKMSHSLLNLLKALQSGCRERSISESLLKAFSL